MSTNNGGEGGSVFNLDLALKVAQVLVLPLVLVGFGYLQAREIESLKTDLALQIQKMQVASEQVVAEINAQGEEDVAEITARVDQAEIDLTDEIENSRIAIERKELALEQGRFDAEEKARKDLILREYVPRLLSTTSTDRDLAVAVLLVLYPQEAKTIIETVAESKGGTLQILLEPKVEAAGIVAEAAGEFIVIVANYLSFEEADGGLDSIDELGYSAKLDKIEGFFVTGLGPYPTREDADRSIIAATADITKGAYILNLKKACPVIKWSARSDSSAGGYFRCLEED